MLTIERAAGGRMKSIRFSFDSAAEPCRIWRAAQAARGEALCRVSDEARVVASGGWEVCLLGVAERRVVHFLMVKAHGLLVLCSVRHSDSPRSFSRVLGKLVAVMGRVEYL
jgi:hypothetical protein